MKLKIDESIENMDCQLIELPELDLSYDLVHNYSESVIVSKNELDFNNRTATFPKYPKCNEYTFEKLLENKIIASLEKVAISALGSFPNVQIIDNHNYTSVGHISKLRSSDSNKVFSNTYSFAFYLDLILDCSKYILNESFKEHISKFTIRFGNHVTIEYQGQLLDSEDISLGNIMLVDKYGNEQEYKDVINYIKTTFFIFTYIQNTNTFSSRLYK